MNLPSLVPPLSFSHSLCSSSVFSVCSVYSVVTLLLGLLRPGDVRHGSPASLHLLPAEGAAQRAALLPGLCRLSALREAAPCPRVWPVRAPSPPPRHPPPVSPPP